MVAYDVISNKEYVLRGATAMVVDFSQFGSISRKRYGEPLGDLVCFCVFEKALLAGQLVDFGDPVHPVMNCIEKLSTRQLVYSQMVSLYFVTRFLTPLVTGQGVPAGLGFHGYLMRY